MRLLLAILVAIVSAGCASSPRDPVAELDASMPRLIHLSYDEAFGAAAGAAMDCGYTPQHADRQTGELSASMEGRFDGNKTARAAAANVGKAVVQVGVVAAEFVVALGAALMGGGNGTFRGTDLHFSGSSDRVHVGLYIRVKDLHGEGASVQAVVVAPGSRHIEPEFAEKFWAALQTRAPVDAGAAPPP